MNRLKPMRRLLLVLPLALDADRVREVLEHRAALEAASTSEGSSGAVSGRNAPKSGAVVR
jgi:hypothetical protein